MSVTYSCKTCGLAVLVVSPEKVLRPCGHDKDPIVANASATMRGVSSSSAKVGG